MTGYATRHATRDDKRRSHSRDTRLAWRQEQEGLTHVDKSEVSALHGCTAQMQSIHVRVEGKSNTK